MHSLPDVIELLAPSAGHQIVIRARSSLIVNVGTFDERAVTRLGPLGCRGRQSPRLRASEPPSLRGASWVRG